MINKILNLINNIIFKLYIVKFPEKKKILRYIIYNNFRNLSEYKKYQHSENIAHILYKKFKFTEFNNLMFENKPFTKWYLNFSKKNIISKNNWHSFDRKFNLDNILKLTLNIKGDLAEAGCWLGFSSYLMCKFVKNNKINKKIYLFDSFKGLPKTDIKKDDCKYWKEGKFEASEIYLHKNLNKFTNYKVYKGWIPKSFVSVINKKFSFVHIDVDLYKPTIESLFFFYSKMSKGGVILFDDYNFKNCKGHKTAIDEFFEKKKEKIIILSSGQAFIIKI